MKLLFNTVLIKFDPPHESITVAGQELQIDTSFNPLQHTSSTGTVLSVPERLIFDRKDSAKTMEYDVPMELQVGDNVILNYLSYAEAIKNEPIDGGHPVRYDEILVALRGEQVIPVNGLLLVEPLNIADTEEVKEMSKFLVTPEYVKTQKSETRGYVRYVGSPVRGYQMDYREEIYESEDDVKVGDFVQFDPAYAVPLQYELHRSLPMILYRMRRKDILGVLCQD